MPGSPARIRSSILSELRDYCAARGLALQPILDDAGIDRAALEDCNALVPLDPTMHAFDRVARALADPLLGLNFAKEFKPGGSGIAGALMLCAPNVREAVRQLAGLVQAHSPQVEATFAERDASGYLSWRYPDTITAPRFQFVVFGACSIVLRLRSGAGPNWRPLAVEFDHSAPAVDIAPLKEVLGERIRFERPQNVIQIDGFALARPMKFANQALFALVVDLAKRWIETESTVPDIVADVRREIGARLASGATSLDDVARALKLSPSQLQRRLEQVGTTFERVLNDTRADLARNLLSNTNKSMTEIAFELGFTDPSAFSRAARRWFRVTPLNFRRRARLGDVVQKSRRRARPQAR